jgi:glutathione synthase/RimK-type ligase-like ATP-grasp enzyme
MSRILKIQALAHRAVSLLGKTGRQSTVAKRQRADFYRAAWQDAARLLGADAETLDHDVLLIRGNGQSTRVLLNYTELDDPVSLRIAGNKPLVHKLLHTRGVPVPKYREFTLNGIAEAAEFLQAHGTCVVKPASGTGGGSGVTTGIRSSRQLRKASVLAAGHGSELIIEQQIPGTNLRLLFLDGQLLDAIERRPPTVTGDGRSTMSQLVDAVNQRRLQGGFSVAQSILERDADMRQTLAGQGLTLSSVPSKDAVVQLKTVINDNTAEDNVCIADTLHPAVIDVARDAANAVGLRLAGVDIVTSNPSHCLAETGGVVLEVNSAPGLYFHYAGSKTRKPVAIPVLAACLNYSIEPDTWNTPEAASLPDGICEPAPTV